MNPSVETDGFQGTDRFHIVRRLGAGSFGTVFEAFDRERGVTVALKVLRRADPAAIYRFKREFRALSDVTHPNLVTLYELMSNGMDWFFTMELIVGVSFLAYVRPSTRDSFAHTEPSLRPRAPSDAETIESSIPFAAPSVLPAPDWGRLRSVLVQLADGLSALHMLGRVHRDVKPQNVLVSRDGRVVILDFGLVAELAPAQHDRSSGLHAVGTPAYMSPEQARGVLVTEASDWYSVGVMLYEALTGSLPFRGGTLEVLALKQRDEPVPPGERAPGVPEDLDLLCRALLRRHPDERPSGSDVLRNLRGEAKAPPLTAGHLRSSGAAPLVGRKTHLAALHESFARTKEGRTASILIRGRSGMGKTTLVRHFLKEVADRDPTAIILSGRCYERESMPYKALDSLVDSLCQYLKALPPQEAEALLPHDVSTLARLFPVLKRVEPISRARRRGPESPDSQELRRRAVAALRELFTRLADRCLPVLFIDDLQWGDADSAAVLSEILRPPDAPALLLIGCTRSENGADLGLASFLTTQRSALEGDPLATPTELSVEELAPEEAEELARDLLGPLPKNADTAHEIALGSRGNPFFLYELVHATLIEQGRPGASPTLQELIADRVTRLPDDARRLLEVVAVAGEPLERSVAFGAADLHGAAAEAVALLQNHRLVRTQRMKGWDALVTMHDQVRETIVRRLSPERAKAHHWRLAHALEAWGHADPEALGVHFHAAEELETASEYVVKAAQQASDALAFDRAARLYVLALSLGKADRDARALRVRLGEALANAGRGAESAEAYSEAAHGASAAENLELRRRAAEQLLRSGHVERGSVAIRDVLAGVGMKLPSTPEAALLSLLLRRAWIRIRGMRFRERDASQVSAERLMRIDICWSVAAGLGIIDPIRGNDFQARQLLLALGAGEPYRVARALALEVAYSATAGGRSRRRTEKLWNVTASLAKRIGHSHTLGLATFAAGFAAYLEGRWRTGQELCDRAEAILREGCTGVAWELGNARFYALRSLVFMGRYKELAGRLPSYLKDARVRGDLYEETNLRARVSCSVLLVLDKPEKARQEIQETLAHWSRGSYYVQHYYDLFGQTEIDLYEGNAQSAWRRIVAAWPAFQRSLLRRIQLVFLESCHLHARAVLAAVAAGTLPEWRAKLAERDARRIERAGMKWSDPFAQLIRASIAALRKDRAAAAALLASAETGFEDTDAGLYAAVARFRRGDLTGGTEGRRLIAEAEAWMTDQRVANPTRLCALLAPGRWASQPLSS